MVIKKPKHLGTYVSVVVSGALIAVLVSYAPWSQVGGILSDLDLGTVLILIALSALYYILKTIRFWYLLQAMGIYKSFKLVSTSYMSAQPVSLLPAGEVYRSTALRKFTGVPIKESLPQFTMQGLLEAGAMVLLMVISTLSLNTLRIPTLVLLILVIISALAISRGYVRNITKFANRLPFLHLSDAAINRFSKRHQAVLTWRWLPMLYAISLVTELVGSTIAFTAVEGLGGHINFYQAMLFYIIPVIVGFVSLLPGGIGISEQSAVGILLLSHVTIAHAVTSTIVMRLSIVGMGLIYGIIFYVIGETILNPDKKNIFQKFFDKLPDKT